MSHASATPITPHSARITEVAPARPLLVVETLDHSAGSTKLSTYGMNAAPLGAVQFTFCVNTPPVDNAQFTYCVQTSPTQNLQFTYCVQTVPAGSPGERSSAAVASEDTVVGSWI
ncbi:hypothetical protein [Streptomyces sp. NPDC001665]